VRFAFAGASGFVEAGLGERFERSEDLGDLFGRAGEAAVRGEALGPGAEVSFLLRTRVCFGFVARCSDDAFLLGAQLPHPGSLRRS